MPTTRADAEALDAADPLAHHRAAFYLPDGLVYLDGNSLGPVPIAAVSRLGQVIAHEWGEQLIRGWNDAGWIAMPRRIGDKIARLIGAQPGEVIVTDSTSVNLFKVLSASIKLHPHRRVILSERDNFPTDLYIAQGLTHLLDDGHALRLVDADELPAAIDGDTAVVMLTQVNYRTGRLYDMDSLTQAAHAHGALMLWDLAHSAGALPVNLTAAQVDLAVGCGYKYLNGGPGAPAYVYVAARHQPHFRQPLSGWLGHASPFAFETEYRPAESIDRALSGTPPILSMSALEVGIESLLAADLHALRAKSLALTELFIHLVDERCADLGLRLLTPRDPAQRGSQVSLAHPEGYAVMQALIARDVIGDFRAPDILRFGLAPLYNRYVDVWDAVEALRDILATRAWDRPQWQRRAAVT